LTPAEVRRREELDPVPAGVGASVRGDVVSGRVAAGAARLPEPVADRVPERVSARIPLAGMPPMDLVLTGRRAASAIARVPQQRTPDERAPDERVPDERGSDERGSGERVPGERVPDERVPAGRGREQRLSVGTAVHGATGRLRRADAGAGSAWWSRAGTAGAAPLTGGAAAPAPPEVPVTGGVTARGLPVRVPLAQLPAEELAAPGNGTGPAGGPPRPAAEPDPDDVGSTLARFYSGVRRAETEEPTQHPAVPAGPQWREEQR
jgi:hypothetical protein